ncbi:MAG TPA: ribosome small subunit-dependent GTPase A [Kofleriaceae bacterium]|nr:ribosome small subunit-dependent GTPase A [Kofleriaceae bacterium]
MASLEELGWNEDWAATLTSSELDAARAISAITPARVAIEHRGAVEVVDESGAFWAQATGKMFLSAGDKRALPIVGDWVAVGDAANARASGSRAPLRAILPRRTCLVRRAAGEREEPQPLAANVDVAFVVTSANQELNPRRLERYLTTVRDGGASPVIVLNKIDLVGGDATEMVASIDSVAGGAPVVTTSARKGAGLDALAPFLGLGRTAVVVGSSGVGKSTIVNALMAGAAALETQAISELGDRGRHTTTRRELFVLSSGGVLIDTPGMRELQLWGEDGDTSAAVFEDISALAARCRFSDCRHQAEPGCAVRAAVDAGTLDAGRLTSFHKLAAERANRPRPKPPGRRR